jgi:hypothetical protein
MPETYFSTPLESEFQGQTTSKLLLFLQVSYSAHLRIDAQKMNVESNTITIQSGN